VTSDPPMKYLARAPGKVVVSGAYAVLSGAPAIVSAVDRYAIADATRRAERVTPEVQAALAERPAPWFDASALRDRGEKLGLGSSAAIVVASLAAIEVAGRGELPDAELCAAVLSRALAAHALAQGGGSGIDVAASAHGGTLIAQRRGDVLDVRKLELPDGIVVQVWATGHAASTSELIGRVRALAEQEAAQHRRLLDAQAEAAERAARALERGDGATLVDALGEQRDALERLGAAAGAEIVTPAVRELDTLARHESAVVLPSGAGGGDVALFVGFAAPSAALRARAAELEHRPLAVLLGARGVHAHRA